MRFFRMIALSTWLPRCDGIHRPAFCCCFGMACDRVASLDQYLLSPAAATKKIRQIKNHFIGLSRLSIDFSAPRSERHAARDAPLFGRKRHRLPLAVRGDCQAPTNRCLIDIVNAARAVTGFRLVGRRRGRSRHRPARTEAPFSKKSADYFCVFAGLAGALRGSSLSGRQR